MKRAWLTLAAYVLMAAAATWPVLEAPHRDVAFDLGDSMLVMWAIAWDCEQFGAILGGDLTRIPRFFDANIFHPTPHALALSEHFLAQAVQGCPVYAASGNPILVYNLLFVSTFALSAFGTFLLVRELTGSATAGFVAGILFGFAPSRFAQSSHLHVLSTQWMPLALYGIRRYFTHRRPRALLGAALALAALYLSSGYYLLYFTPFALAYALWEMCRTGLWRERRVWAHGALAAACVAALTLPPLLPYMAFGASGLGRSREEAILYSADVYAYATAFNYQPLWGNRVRAFPRAEGELFPGFVPLALAWLGLLGWRASSRGGQSDTGSPASESVPPVTGAASRWRGWLSSLLVFLLWVHVAAAVVVLVERRVVTSLAGIPLRMTNLTGLLLRILGLWAAVLVISPRARAAARAFMREHGYFAVGLVAAVWLSLGPEPHVLGRPLELFSPYGWLFDHVPGYNGVRAPARFGVIAAFMLTVLAGWGAAVVGRWAHGRTILVVLSLFFFGESLSLPFTVNGGSGSTNFRQPEQRLHPPASAPAVYQHLREVPADAVVVELPLGEPGFDLRAVYYSSVHWRRLVNGYSGYFPRHYALLTVSLSDIPRHPDVAWETLENVGATHALVHEGAYLQGGSSVTRALVAQGATEVFRDGYDVILALR
jgi:hypothetical protein